VAATEKKKLDEKLPTNVSDLTGQLPWGGWDLTWQGGLQGTHLPAAWPWLTCKRQRVYQHSLEKNSLFFLNGKQMGVLIKILWSGWRQSKHGDLAPLHTRH